MKKTTKFSLFSLFSISLITPVVIATQFSGNSNEQTQNNLKASLYKSVNSENLIEMVQNEDALLKKISKKYDENQSIFFSWNSDVKLKPIITNYSINDKEKNNFNYDKNTKITTTIPSGHKHVWVSGRTEPDLDSMIKNSFKQQFETETNPFDVNASLVSKLEYLDKWLEQQICQTEGKYCVYIGTEPPVQKSESIQFNTSDKNNFSNSSVLDFDVFSFENHKKNKNGQSVFERNEKLITFNYDTELINSTNQTLELFEEPLIQFIQFKNKDINWDKFFILKPSAIDNNGSYYLTTNRPTLELGLNLPLVNAIDWYGELPDKFNAIWNLIKDVFNKFANNPFLFNEIFGSKENFFNFFNTYLLNIANFSYNPFEFENLMIFFKDLNTTEPSESIRKSIKELITSKKDIKYKNIVIPANVLNEENNIKSGSDFNSKMLNNYLKINSFNFGIKIPNNVLWKPKEFENNKIINQWNIYSNVILPIILSQDISVTYVDHLGNKDERKAYDGESKQFIPDAIKPAAVLDNFDTPYSSVIINQLTIGEAHTVPFLGKNTKINSKESLTFFANQSLANRTKTIDNKEYVAKNPNDWDDSIYVKGTNNGIEVRFHYLASEKSVEEGAWSKFKDNDKIQPFILIPDEAWGKDEPFDTTPDSTLSELLQDGMKSTILYERAMARPFINKKQITTQDLKDGRAKYINYDKATLVFNQQNIGDVFITKEFKDKYNSQSNKPWWTWSFSELIEQEKKHIQNKSELEVVKKDYYQEEWFKNFIANPKLKNYKLEDFFPKVNEGRLFVVGSYKPSIDSTQVKLKEEAGFYYAGQQRDSDNQITNFNYVVELEVKNKIYNSKLEQFNLTNIDYQNQNISYTQYLQLINHLVNDLPKYFMIDSSRFVQGQIQQPKIEFTPNQGDDFLVSGYGTIKIDYQKSLPIINQVGNDTFTEQLPFDLNNIVGMKEFRNTYKAYLIEDLEAYNKLSASDKESKILLDNKTNQIIIGGKAITSIQNINVSGIGNSNQKDIVVIPTEYLDPKVAIYGFDQKTKKYTSLEEYQKEWSKYNQEQLFDKLFGNYNHNNKAEKLKKIVKDFKVIFSVEISQTHFKVNYQFTDPKTNQTILDTWTLEPLALTDIRPVKLDSVNKSSFKFGYDQTNDANIPFQLLENELKDINKLASHFNFNSDCEKENFIRGIKSIDVKLDSESKKISISLTLNDNFVLYDDQSKLNFDVLAVEVHKVELGNLDLKNMDKLVKDEVAKLNKDEDVLNYLNTLSLDTKKSFFISTNLKLNLLAQENYLDQIQSIIFSFDQKDLVAKVQFKNDNYALAKNDNLRIKNFIYDLKVDLGIINPFKDSLTPWVAGISTTLLILLSGGIAWLWLRKRKQSHHYLGDAKTHKYDINESNVDFDLKEQQEKLENNEDLSEDR